MLSIEKLKNVMFIWKMLPVSFHAPGKTSDKLLKTVRAICVQVREKLGNFFRCMVGTL